MASLDYYRKLHPDKADSEIVLEYARVTGTTPYLAAYDLGADPTAFQHDPDKGALRAGLSSGVDALQGVSWSALGAGADALGMDSLRGYASRAAAENEIEGYFAGRPDLDRVEDQTLGSAVDYGLYQIGRQVPQIGAAVASTFIPIPGTTVATTGALARGLAAVPRALGGGGLKAGMGFAERRAALETGAQFGTDVARATASMYPTGVGSLYQESVDAGDPDAFGALAGGIPYAASEALMPAWLRGSLGRAGGRFAGGLPTRMSKAGALSAGEEVLTELGQNEMEMAFNPTLSEEEIFSRRLNSAVAGGLVGGAFGSLGGLRKPIDTTTPHDLLGGPSQGDMFSGQSWTPVDFPPAEEVDPYNPNNRRQMDFLGELDRTLNPDYRPVYPVGMGGAVFQDTPITDDTYRQPRPDLETAPRIDTPVPQDVGSAVALLRSIGDAPVIEGTQLHEAVVAARGILDAHGIKLTLPKLGTNVAKTSTTVAEPATPAEFKSKRQNELWTLALAEVQDDGYLAGINQAIMERKYGHAEKLIKQAKEEQNAQQQTQPQAQVRQESQGVQAPRENGVVQGAQDGRGAAAPSQGGQVVVPVSPGTDSGVQSAAPVPSPSPRALSLDRLIPAAGLSSQETQLALVLNEVVNQGGNPAKLTNAKIAARMKLGTPNQVTPIRRRVQKKLAKAAERAGVDLQAALAPKRVAPADEAMLGLSPAVQPSVIDEEEVFGSIDGDVSPSFGVIASAGGSQANWRDTGSVGARFVRKNEDTAVPEFIPAETAQAAEEIDARNRARAELMAVLQTPEAEVAGEDWDYLKSPKAPEWSIISNGDKAEWIIFHVNNKTADEDTLREYQREMEQNVEVVNGPMVEDRARAQQGGVAQARPRPDAPRGTEGSVRAETGTEAPGDEPSFSRETGERTADGQAERVSDEEAQQNIAYLERNIKQHLGEEAKAEGTYAPARVPEHGLLGQLAAVWGARIQGFKVVGDKGRYGFFSGVYFGGNRDVIYLNETARRPHVALLGHELVHYLRRNHPELYAQFKEQVFQYVKAGEYQAWSRLFTEKGDKLKEEFLGEVVSDGFMNRTFWEAVSRNNPSLLKRVVAIVNKLVKDALAAIGYTPKTKSVVSDFNRVMEIAGEVMAKAGLEMGAVEQTKDTPSFSRAGEDEFVLPARYTKAAGRVTLIDSSIGFRANDLTRAADKRERAEWERAKNEAEQNGPYVYPEERARLNKWAPHLGKRVRFLDIESVLMGEMDTPTEVIGTLFIRQVVSPDYDSPSPRYKARYEAVVRAADGRESSTLLDDKTLTPMGIARGGDTPSFSRNITDEVIAAAPAPDQPRFSRVAEEPEQGFTPTTAEAIRKIIKDVTGRFDNNRIKIFDTWTDAVAARLTGTLDKTDGSYAWVEPDLNTGKYTAVFIADRIPAGQELAVFLHEVGSHLGMAGLIGEQNSKQLAMQIKKWAVKKDGSLESVIARRAMNRVKSAQADGDSRDADLVVEERIAYFVEEAVKAGINPAATKGDTEFGRWFRTLWAAVKTALRKIGFQRFDKLTAQNIVDLAYGAARLELAGTWHGTAANFRNFNHDYMGTGEGAQAYGWGTYLAQRPGIAKGYWEADTSRRGFLEPGRLALLEERLRDGVFTGGRYADIQSNYGKDMTHAELSAEIAKLRARAGSLMRVDVNAQDDELLDWDKPLSEQSEKVKEILAGEFPEVAGEGAFFWGLSGKKMYEQLIPMWKSTASDKAASEYLDSIGIKGIKFLDARSRGNFKVTVSAVPQYRSGTTKWTAVVYRSGDKAFDEVFATEAEARKAADDFVASRNTRNLVIFNDKNIQRVVTQVGAQQDRVKFSKAGAASAKFTDQVIAAAPAPAQKAMHTVVDTLEDFSGRTLNYSMFTNDLVEKVSDVLPSAKAWYEGINKRETIQIEHKAKVDDIANLVDQLPQAKFNRTWRLIKDMTKEGKWGYAPTWRADVTVDPAMQERYNALDKDEQDIIDQVFRMGDETIRETQAALDAIADEIYNDKLTKARDDRTKAKLEKEKGKFKRVFRKDLSVLEGPYAPMRRVGDYVTVAKSARYADLEKAANKGDTKAADELMQLRSDGKHYQVVFSDNLAQARAVERELHAQGFPRHLTSASAKEVYTGEDRLPFQAFEQLRQMAAVRDERGRDVEKLMNLIDELYLSSLADTSARKSELRRTGVEGIISEGDSYGMYRAFLSKGEADAHYLSILKTHQQVSQDFTSMREESKSIANRADKMDAFNELKLRYENSFNYDPAPFFGRLMNISAMWYLMTKPAYYLYNLTQPLMMAQPYIAQKFNYGESMGAMTKAYDDLVRSQGMFNLEHINLNKLPEDIRQMLNELRDAGRIDITITQDLGSRIHAGRGRVSKSMAKVERALRTATQKTEMVNRIVTAAAAYRLALAKTKDHVAAVKYAKEVVDRTQGLYSNFNAPRLLNATNFRKLITQFRKFQFIQASLLIRMVNDSLRSATPHERAMARKALMFMLGHHAVLAGALGLPLANVVAMAFSMTGGDDEPRDLELWMRRELGDNAMADLLMHGVPAVFNVNVSSNVGMGQTFSVVPFADVDMTGAGFKELTFAAMGPVFGLGRKGWEAMGKAQQGDYYGFLAGVLPGAASSSLKSINEFAAGVENKRGDVLVSPDEISFMDSVVKALGFKTQDDTIRQLVRGQQYEFEQFFKDRTTEVKKAYTEAYRDGDYEEMMALRERWREMQEFRREYGFKPQPLSTLIKAPAEQRKREAQTIGGVQYNSGNKGFVAENAAP